MKKMMIIGGLIGFLIGIVFSLKERSGWPAVLWRSSIGALGAGLLLRWWGGIWLKSLQQAQAERIAATATATAPTPKA